MPIKDMTGLKFTRLLVISREASDNNGNARWRCKCDCGQETVSYGFNLRNGESPSCGCISREQLIARIYKHGNAGGKDKKKTSTYTSWASMHSRCFDPQNKKFHLYGGRGITIYKRWRSFENFLADMGQRPSIKHSIDRYPNRNGNYEPGNCRWATYSEQNNNKSNQHWVCVNEEKMTLTQAVERFGKATIRTTRSRMRRGWPLSKALNTPALS